MSTAPLPPRLSPIPPADRGPGGDGFGPESLGHRVPAIRTPGRIAALVGQLTMARDAGPLIPEAELEALLYALVERYRAARERLESFQASIAMRAHEGRHREFRWDEERRLTPPRP